LIKKKPFLILLKQFGKEKKNEIGIGKNKRQNNYSLNAHFNPSFPFCLRDPKNLVNAHLSQPPIII
jgi:hypothetical protein